MTPEQEKELRDLILEYGVATLVERNHNRIRQIQRIILFVQELTYSRKGPTGPQPTYQD